MLGFSCFMLAGWIGVVLWVWRTDRGRGWWRVLLGLGVGAMAACALLWPGLFVMQKGLTAMMMPAGLVWMGLVGLVICAGRLQQRVLFRGALGVLLLLTAAANNGLTKLAFNRLEGEYQKVDPMEAGGFDVVFVLGGGGGRGPEGQLNVSSSGDRVVLGARLYHSGRAGRLVCTGRVGASYHPSEADPGRLTYLLLLGMGVPEGALERLGGRNTREEMEEIEVYLKRGGGGSGRRIGVVTSCWHMRRAMRLARERGLELVPLPSDFRGGDVGWRDFSFLPDGHALSQMGLATKERLAGWVGR